LIRQLEPLKPLFIEEPLLPEHSREFSRVTGNTSVPIAAGERLFGREAFAPLLESGAVDIIQPDLSHAGGIWEVRKIAAMAEAYDIAVAPHCPLGPLALAASLQLDFCTPNAVLQETSLGIHYNRAGGGAELTDYLVDGKFFDLVDGYFLLNDRPGLGVEIDEPAVRKAAERGHQWRNPIWRHQDGSVAEW
jgi:galactonate dehydratase